MTNVWTYIKGFTIANARDVALYAFGDYLIRVEKNIPDHTYDVYLDEGADVVAIKYYKEFWGGQYRIFFETTTVSETVSKEFESSN